MLVVPNVMLADLLEIKDEVASLVWAPGPLQVEYGSGQIAIYTVKTVAHVEEVHVRLKCSILA